MSEEKSSSSSGFFIIGVILFLMMGSCDDHGRKIRDLEYRVGQLQETLTKIEKNQPKKAEKDERRPTDAR